MALQIWMPMVSDFNNQGLQNSTITNNSVTLDNNGKLGKCGKFTGSNYISGTINLGDSIEYTLACWVKPPDVSAGNKQIVAIAPNSGWANCRATMFYRQNTAEFIATLSNGTDSLGYTMGMTAIPNVWQHIAVTFKNKTMIWYSNGVVQKTLTTTIDPKFSDITAFGIGGASNGAEKFTGYINDVRIYDHALSPREIEILSRGLVAHYPLNGGGRGGDNLLIYSNVTEANFTALKNRGSGTWNKLSLTTKDGYDCYLYDKSLSSTAFSTGAWYSLMKANTTYTYSAWIYFTASANFNFGSLGHFQVYNSNSTASDKSHEDIVDARIYEPSTIPANKWTKIRITFTTNNLANSYFQVYPRYNIGANVGDLYFRDCKLEEGDHVTPWIPNSADAAYTAMGYNSTTEYDVSGYGYNGTKNGTIAYLTDTPRYNVSTNIKGASSYIKIPNLTTTGFSNSYSFAWWGKVPSYQGYMMWGFSDGQRLNGIFNGNLWNTGDGASNPLYVPGTTTQVTVPTTNTWHHFVMTGDGTTCKVYQDGVLWGQAKTYKSISGTTIYINGWDASTSYTYGDYQMSDFRIYATALSATQVAELYNTAVSVANNGTLMGYELVEG